jgi:hypothetical protein
MRNLEDVQRLTEDAEIAHDQLGHLIHEHKSKWLASRSSIGTFTCKNGS